MEKLQTKLPNGWKIVTFEQVQDRNHHYPIGDGDHGNIKPKNYQSYGVPYIRVADIVNDEIDTKNLTYISEETHKNNPKSHLFPNDVIIAKTGATIGKVAIIPQWMKLANTTSSIGKITTDHRQLIPQYLYYYLKTENFRNMMYKVSEKSAQGGFNIDDIKKFTIFLPPIEEQEKIVSILSNVDMCIKKISQIIEETQLLKNGLMQRLFSKGIKHTKFKKLDWFFGDKIEIPNSWKYESLQSICKEVTIGVVNSATPYYTEKSKGIPYFRSQNVRSNNLTNLNLVYVKPEFNEIHPRSILREGDVLTVQTGVKTGMTCVVPKDYVGCNCHSLIITRPDPKILLSVYLSQLLNSTFGKKMLSTLLMDFARGHLLVEDWRMFKILLPPVSEQKEITTILNDMDLDIKQKIVYKSNLELLKKGLIQKLFTGKISVISKKSSQ